MSFSEILEMLWAFRKVFLVLGIFFALMFVFLAAMKHNQKRWDARVAAQATPYAATYRAHLKAKSRIEVLGRRRYYMEFVTDSGQQLVMHCTYHDYRTPLYPRRDAYYSRVRGRVYGALTVKDGQFVRFEPEEGSLT